MQKGKGQGGGDDVFLPAAAWAAPRINAQIFSSF